MKKNLLSIILLTAAVGVSGQDLQLNDKEYFERQGVNVLVFSNSFNGGFNDEKNSGIEIVHHGVRTVQGGAVRLNNTPEQWDLVPKMTSRKVDRENNSIEVALRYDDYDFDSRVVVTSKGAGVEIAVWLDKPVPEALAGEAGFNMEFLPSQYWLKTFVMDGRLNRFPRYATSQTITRPNAQKPRQFKGFKTYDDRGTNRFIDPLPIDSGHTILMAQDAPERMIRISSTDGMLKLYDGRMLAQNGWFVLRSVLPKGKTGKALTWTDGYVSQTSVFHRWDICLNNLRWQSSNLTRKIRHSLLHRSSASMRTEQKKRRSREEYKPGDRISSTIT